MFLISKLSQAAYPFGQWWCQVGSKLYHYYTDDFFLITCLLAIFLAITVARWWHWSTKKTPPLPPGPLGLPILGNLPFIGTNLHHSFTKLANTYGPIMKLRLSTKLCIVVTSPSLAKEIFKDHDTIFANHDLPAEVMAAGTKSTSGIVEWALTELMKNPHVMKTVQEEIEEVVGLNNIVEESHLPKLHYLHGVVKEVLHLHPPAPFLIPRCPSVSCTIGGFMVPKGCKVIVNAWAIQRDPLNWVNPSEFQPERFLRKVDDEYDYSGKNYRYILFGSGRRVCVGIPMAERMIPYLLTSISHSFHWELPNGVELGMSDKFGLELKKATPLVCHSFTEVI